MQLMNPILARACTVMSMFVCACTCAAQAPLCVCLASVGSPWEEGGRSVMNCEEVAGLSDQTQGNKEEPSTKVWLLQLRVNQCRRSNLINWGNGRLHPSVGILSLNSLTLISLFSSFCSLFPLRLLLLSTFALHVAACHVLHLPS